MTITSPAFLVEGLTKRYGDRAAVDELTVSVPAASSPGSSARTAPARPPPWRCCSGWCVRRPATGTVLGEPLEQPERYLGRVGALIEGPALWPALTATENLRVLARLGGHDEARIPELLDLVGLADRAGDRFGRYSLGMKQRLGIAAALLGDPELLVLDEPTNGLDPVGISEMRDLIGRLAGGDRTVLVSSHLLSELEHVCDWLLIIDGGRLVYAGEREGFSGRGGTEIVLGPLDPADLLPLADLVAAHGHDAGRDGEQLVARRRRRTTPPTSRRAQPAPRPSAGIALAELHVRRPTLEASYLRLLEGDAR